MRSHITRVGRYAQRTCRWVHTVVIDRKIEGGGDSVRFVNALAIDSPHGTASTNAATPTESITMTHHRWKSMSRRNAPWSPAVTQANRLHVPKVRFATPGLLQLHIHVIPDLEGAQ